MESYWIEGKILWVNGTAVPQGTTVFCCIRCSLDGGQTWPWNEATTFGTVYDDQGNFGCNVMQLPSNALTGVAYCYGMDGGIIVGNGEVPNAAPGTTILNLVTAKPPASGGQ
jgi:hypothetical protein